MLGESRDTSLFVSPFVNFGKTALSEKIIEVEDVRANSFEERRVHKRMAA